MEEQKPIESSLQDKAQVVESSPQNQKTVKKLKLLGGALLGVILVVGLYFVNRYWISPAVKTQMKGSLDHPLAPGFSLTDITGQPLKLSDYQGKVVMLDFWATWCGPCRIEIPGFIQLQNQYRGQGLAIIGISMDDDSKPVVEFFRELHMNYPVAVGNDRLGELYGGVLGLPTTFLIGRDGRIYAKHVGATDLGIFEAEIKQLLALSANGEATSFHQAGQVFAEDKIELGNPTEVDSEVPGVDQTKLSAEQKEAFKKQLADQQCTCGCKFNLLKCRQVDRKCGVSLKLARQQLEAFLKNKG
ncbi:MAG: TlpA family protein disulfide reductase [Acidobacteriia bacterium]|nr:TlpA family protein disulfide reductase [Terriglobia bacterium]